MPKLVRRAVPVPSKLDAALALHAAGWWVVPQAGKRAVVPGWEQYRLIEEDLREYLADGRLNIAIVLSQSAVIDVECDTPEAEAAFLSACGGIAPPTPTWASRRGLHRLFIRPDGLPDRAKIEADGIEFRLGNRAALSTVPPSVHPDNGSVYRWLPGLAIGECEPAILPDGLLKILKGATRRRAPSANGDETTLVDIREGARNDTLFRLGCRVARTGSADDVANNIHGANKLHCKPPLEDAEVNKIVEGVTSTIERGKTNILPLRCSSWEEVVTAWKAALEWRSDMADVLAVMFAVAASTSQTGDQLFLQVVGSPGSAKTRFCDAMLVSPRCRRVEKLTGVFSGMLDYEDKSKDYSFLARSNHMTWITPEADIAMTQGSWTEIMSQMRRVFDGSASASYKNRDHDLEHNGLRTPWIMAGTPAMIEKDQSRLGDRFLRIHIVDPDETMKLRILQRVGHSAWDAVCQESNCSPDSILSPELLRAYRLTGGYVDWLRENVTTKARAVRSASDAADVVARCTVLSDFTAYMRSRPPTKTSMFDPDYEPTKDLPTRLQAQFIRMCSTLAVALNRPRVDDDIMRIVRRVALDTGRGRTFTLVGQLAKDGRNGTVPGSLAVRMREGDEKISRWLAHMEKVGAVTSWRPMINRVQNLRRWRLSDRMETLYREVMRATEAS